jgi:HK97 family phage major capsid protein
MENITLIREKVATLANQAKHLIAEKGDQVWTAEDQTKFDNLADEITRGKAQISSIEKMREMEADAYFNVTPKKQGDTVDAMSAIAAYMRFGNNVSAEQAIAIKNAMSTTTPAEGGYTVPAEIAQMVIDRLKYFGGMRDAAEIITTASGTSLNYPTSDGTAEVGEIVGQNAAATGQDITFGTVSVNPFRYSSKKIALPIELIQDSAIDVISFVINRLATRIARIQNTHFTTGAGTTLPDGVIPKSSVGKTGTTGQTLTVTYADIVDLKHSVDVSYRMNAKFMLNDLSIATISKLVDTTGRPIWNPGDYEGIALAKPDTLLGFPIIVNNDVAVMAANAKSIAFGDFSKYIIRDVANSVSLGRYDDSAFALNGQVGFCAWARSGGNLIDTNSVKVYQNSAT